MIIIEQLFYFVKSSIKQGAPVQTGAPKTGPFFHYYGLSYQFMGSD